MCSVAADWFGIYPLDTKETCFPAKAGTQTGLPPLLENPEARTIAEYGRSLLGYSH